MSADNDYSEAAAGVLPSSSMTKQVAEIIIHEQPKQDEKTEESTESSLEGAGAATAANMEKRKRDRRFPRFFRTAATSPTKKPRFERRRSTGSDPNLGLSSANAAQQQDDDNDAPPSVVPHRVSRSSPFLRRNASMGNSNDSTNNEDRAMLRKRSLFRRGGGGGRQQQQRQQPETMSSPPTRPAAVPKERKSPLAEGESSTPWFEQTQVITVRKSPPREEEEEEKKEEDHGEAMTTELVSTHNQVNVTDTLCASTEIFQHSYLETLCGLRGHDAADDSSMHDDETTPQLRRLPDDPTVQESIECVFSTHLEEDISRMLQLDDDDEDDSQDDQVMAIPVAPSQIQQSVLRTRSDLSRSTPPQHRSRKRVESVKLAHVGSFRSSGMAPSLVAASTSSSMGSFSACACKCQRPPQMDPSAWPQAPLLLRPTPGSGTRVHCIRLVRNDNDDSILWKAGQPNKQTWSQALKKYWGMEDLAASELADAPMCPECVVLPINNGNEKAGETLVTDFESDLFVGTLMLRLRHCNGTTRMPYRDDRGYFTGMNRRYQAVIRGRFKKELQWTQCKTGFVLDRPAGKLPAKWILKGAVKVLSFFAPHLEVKFDGPRPMSVTPLGSTPQVLAVHSPDEPYDMEGMQEEPNKKEHSLLGEVSTAPSSLQRARLRKKSFDKLYAHQSPTPRTDPSKMYTFEFLQHLFNFQDFSVELGSMLGSVPLAPIADGQALPIMASYADLDQRLWSFDVWHESLVTGNNK